MTPSDMRAYRYRLHDTTGDDLGTVEHPAPNVEPGDVVTLPDGREALVVARVEETEGEPMLVIPGGVGAQVGFVGSIGGNSFDATEAGFVRLRTALRDLVRNEWFVAEVTSAEMRVWLGPQAKKLRIEAA